MFKNEIEWPISEQPEKTENQILQVVYSIAQCLEL